MPMDFPDMKSLVRAASVHKFRQPKKGESEDDYREAFDAKWKAEAERDRLREALEWYKQLVQRLCDDDSLVWTDALQDAKNDGGQRARDALAGGGERESGCIHKLASYPITVWRCVRCGALEDVDGGMWVRGSERKTPCSCLKGEDAERFIAERRRTWKVKMLPDVGDRFQIDGHNYKVTYLNEGKMRFTAEPTEAGAK